MKNDWQSEKIGNVATPIARAENPVAGKIYRQIGVRLWGEGAYERETVDGSQTRYPFFFRVEPDDIVVNKIWARNGSVAVVPQHLGGSYVSSEFPTFAPNLEKLEPRWFHWITKTKNFWERCDAKSRGTSGKNRIRPELFLQIEIPLPPLPEQQRIVARIEELARRVEEAQGLRKTAVEEADKVMSAAIASIFSQADDKRLRLGDDQNARVIAGQHVMAEDCTQEGIGIPYMTGPADFGSRISTPSRWTDKGKVNCFPGDVLVTVKGAGVGKTNIAPNFETAIGRQIMAIRPSKKFITDYVYYFARHSFQSIKDAATATTVPGVKKEDIEGILIPDWDLQEQHRIVAHLDNLQQKVDELRRLQTATQKELDALMPSILAKAFAGEL